MEYIKLYKGEFIKKTIDSGYDEFEETNFLIYEDHQSQLKEIRDKVMSSIHSDEIDMIIEVEDFMKIIDSYIKED